MLLVWPMISRNDGECAYNETGHCENLDTTPPPVLNEDLDTWPPPVLIKELGTISPPVLIRSQTILEDLESLLSPGLIEEMDTKPPPVLSENLNTKPLFWKANRCILFILVYSMPNFVIWSPSASPCAGCTTPVPGARGQGLGAKAQVPRPRGLGSGAMGQRPGAWSCLGSGAWRQGPRARGQGPGDTRQGYDACARARRQGPGAGARLQRPRRHGPRGQSWVGIRMLDESGVSGAAAMQRNPPIYAPNGTWCPSFSPNYEKTTPNPKQGPNA